MALECTVCSTELEALGARRCRKCRQLVCQKCIEPATLDAAEGVCCVSCAGEEEVLASKRTEEAKAQPVDPSPAASSVGDTPLVLPTWSWVVIGVTLSAVFGMVAYYPTYRLHSLERDLMASAGDSRERGARGLVELGTDSALNVLVHVAYNGPEPSRLAAAEALGRFPSPRVPEVLREILGEDDLHPELRAALEESQIRHQAVFGSPPEVSEQP